MPSKTDLIVHIAKAIDSHAYDEHLAQEALGVLERLVKKLRTMQQDDIQKLLAKAYGPVRQPKPVAAKRGIDFSKLKVGQQPDLFDAASKSEVNVLLWGAPGRGKSQLADLIGKRHAERVGGTMEQMVCPEDTQVSILAGAFQPAEGGAWKWMDGPVTRVLRTGGALVLDELAHLSPEAQTWLLAALDRTPTLTLPSGEVITKQPVWVIATQNDTPGSLLPPLADRLPIQQKVSLPYTWEWLKEFAPLAERDLSTQEFASLRPWAALRRMTDAGVPLEQSVKLLWPDSPSQMNAIKLALDAAS